jgi:glutaconate CoA-transferase, subunit A
VGHTGRTKRGCAGGKTGDREQVQSLDAPPNACMLPSWVIDAVCLVPRGATPSYAHGYYDRDNAFYQRWDLLARDREVFTQWLQRHVLNTADFAAYQRVLAESSRETFA